MTWLLAQAAEPITQGKAVLWLIGGTIALVAIIATIVNLLDRGPRFLKSLISYAAMLALAAFLMAPFVWMVLISLRPSKSEIPELKNILVHKVQVKDSNDKPVMVKASDGKLEPKTKEGFYPQWKNYTTVMTMEDIPVLRFFINSLVVTISVVVGQLFVTSLAAYAFSRLRFKGRDPLFYLFLASMMFAGPITQLPVYLLCRNLGWLDTYWALIVPGLSSAFNVFLFRQFFMSVPRELDEAARIDGAGDFKIYWKVVLPLSKAALATAGAFTFFAVWTDFFWPLLATNSMQMRTLEVGLSVFRNSYGGYNWPLQMTAAVIVMLPLLVMFLFTQRYFSRGIMLGSIK
jgi:multiple sugar transport system permease protein